MKKKLKIGLIAVLWPFLNTFSQTEQIQVSADDGLQVGDTVPDITIRNIVNYPAPKAKISDFKGKLLIIDFWATWCSSCVKNFPKLNNFKKHFDDRLEILLVSSSAGDNQERVDAFFRKREAAGFHNSLPYILGDTVQGEPVLKKLFPHSMIPHYVWIGPDRVIKAITSAEQINEENLLTVLDGKNIDIPQKTEINKHQPLFTVDALPNDKLKHFSIFIKGYYDGLACSNVYRRKNGVTYGRALTNHQLLWLFTRAVKGMYPDFAEGRVSLQVDDSSELIYDSSKYSGKTEWVKKNSYTYELSVPLEDADSLYYYMLCDLNRYSGYTGKIEYVLTPVFVFTKDESRRQMKDTQATAGTDSNSKNQLAYKAFLRRAEKLLNPTPSLKNNLIQGFGLSNEDALNRPLIDETGYSGSLPKELLNHDFNSLDDLRSIIHRFGLKVDSAKRPLKTLVITRKK